MFYEQQSACLSDFNDACCVCVFVSDNECKQELYSQGNKVLSKIPW